MVTAIKITRHAPHIIIHNNEGSFKLTITSLFWYKYIQYLTEGTHEDMYSVKYEKIKN